MCRFLLHIINDADMYCAADLFRNFFNRKIDYVFLYRSPSTNCKAVLTAEGGFVLFADIFFIHFILYVPISYIKTKK